MYDDTYRSTAFKRFPYAIIYLVSEAKVEVYIIAISHQHRNPACPAPENKLNTIEIAGKKA